MGEVLVYETFKWGFAAGLDCKEIKPDEREAYEKEKEKMVPGILRDFLKEHYSNVNKLNKPNEQIFLSTDATQNKIKEMSHEL